MAHKIGKHDKQQGTQMAWHNLTEVLPVILLANCFLSTFDVVKRRLLRLLKDGTTEETETCELVCTDDDTIRIGKPVDCVSYTVLGTKQFLGIVQGCMDKIRGSFVASVGSVCDRARIFVSLAIPNLETLETAQSITSGQTLRINAAGRDFEFYLSFLSSFDKSCPFTVVMSSICVVCNNTFDATLNDKDGKKLRISIPHTKNMNAALQDVPEIVDAFFTSAQVFAKTMNDFAAIPISANDAKAFFAGFLAEKDKSQEADDASESDVAEMSTRREGRVDRLLSLFVSGKGNSGANHADLFSAITDYYSHESSGGDDKEKQIASSMFGNGATMKAAAFAIMKDDARTAKLIAKGHKLLVGAKE